MTHACGRSESNLAGSVFSYDIYVGSRDQTCRLSGLLSKCLSTEPSCRLCVVTTINFLFRQEEIF